MQLSKNPYITSRQRQLQRSARGTIQTRAVPSQLRLLHPVKLQDSQQRPLLVYLPGTDGTGQAILPQVDGLIAAGFDVKCLFIPPNDRSNWQQLRQQAQALVDSALSERPRSLRTATIVGESFGGCLALLLAEAAPWLVDRMVLVNPATSFVSSLQGLSAFVSATNLLGLFPQPLYTTAQAVLLPLLININRVGPDGTDALRRMIFMQPTPDFDRYDDGPSRPSRVDSTGFVFPPAAAANFRTNLLRQGGIPDERLARISTPTLVLSAARDRMLPSITEGARLQRALPNARRVILPDSGHAALLEAGVNLAKIMADNDFMPEACKAHSAMQSTRGAQVGAVAAGDWGRSPSSSRSSSRNGSAASSRASSPVNAAVGASDAVSGALLPVAAAAATGAAAAGTGLSVIGEVASTSYASSGNGSSIGNGHSRNGSTYNGNGNGSGQTSNFAASRSSISMPNTSTSGLSSTSAFGSPANGNGTHAETNTSSSSSRNSSSSSSSSTASTRQQQESAWDRWCQILAPWRDLVSPVVVGSELLPNPRSKRAMLFVGNHQLMGLYDMPLLFYELYMRGFEAHGLAHPGHWSGPMGSFFEQFGAVKAGPMTAYKLLKNKEQVLLFPGGAREVHKRKGEQYKLFWPDSPEFVRLAAKFDAIIVPFAAVGADDAYDVLLDGQEVLDLPVIGNLINNALQQVDPSLKPLEAVMPLTRLPGLGLPAPIPVPNLGRLYFKFCKPVDTRDLKGGRGSQEWQDLYDGVKSTVEGGIAELLELRERDGQRDVGPRLAATLRSWLPMVSNTAMSERPVPQVATAEANEHEQEL